ncbi:MAG TPA: MotA/TolQ/ExbB proton channel family protein [Myxococcota bacterium]
MALAQRTRQSRASGPTDLSLGVTGAVAAAATLLFYGAVVLPLSGTYVGELFAARGWVPYVISVLSFWAAVMLLLKYRLIARQREVLELDLLPERIGERITPENAAAFAAHLSELPPSAASNALVGRIRRALHHFEARRDAREVVDQLSGQTQADVDAVESSYTMLRVFIWAIPILGFIGTVIGIGAAVGGFSESVGAAVDLEVMKDSIGSVTTGLAVAFDTTLLALVMSILIMFPASSLQKAEEDFLTAVEDYCDEKLVRRLDDGRRDTRPEDRVIRDAVAREMAVHHEELRGWLERLGQIGETLTAHVVSGWEKVDEQMRVRQDQQMERLARWASERQREASDELSETQRALLRDFRGSLEGMAAEARRIQEEGAHRLDDQLAGIERLHRRLLEEQQGAAEAHRAQTQSVSAAGDQLVRTLARVRSEAEEVRDEGARQLGAFGAQLGEIAQSAQQFQRGLFEAQEAQASAFRTAAERLALTLSSVEEQLARARELADAQRAAGAEERESLDRAREQARRDEAALRDAQIGALRETSEALSHTLEALRDEARAARGELSAALGDLAPELAQRLETLASEFAAPWRRQLAQLERAHERLEQAAGPRQHDGSAPGSRIRRLFNRD